MREGENEIGEGGGMKGRREEEERKEEGSREEEKEGERREEKQGRRGEDDREERREKMEGRGEERLMEKKEEKRRGSDRGEGSIENNRRHLSFSEYLLDTNDSSPVLILRVAVPAAGQWSCVVFY